MAVHDAPALRGQVLRSGVCHCLMKMDFELLGDGWEKDGKEPSEMDKRTRFPRAPFPPHSPWDRGVPQAW